MFQYPLDSLVMNESRAFPSRRTEGMDWTDSTLKKRLPLQ